MSKALRPQYIYPVLGVLLLSSLCISSGCRSARGAKAVLGLFAAGLYVVGKVASATRRREQRRQVVVDEPLPAPDPPPPAAPPNELLPITVTTPSEARALGMQAEGMAIEVPHGTPLDDCVDAFVGEAQMQGAHLVSSLVVRHWQVEAAGARRCTTWLRPDAIEPGVSERLVLTLAPVQVPNHGVFERAIYQWGGVLGSRGIPAQPAVKYRLEAAHRACADAAPPAQDHAETLVTRVDGIIYRPAK